MVYCLRPEKSCLIYCPQFYSYLDTTIPSNTNYSVMDGMENSKEQKFEL